jgi:signal peptidase II
MKQRYLILFSLSGFILSLDQLLKHLIQSKWTLQSEHSLIPGFLKGVYKQNYGFGFGLLQQSPKQLQEIFFIAVPIFALVLIVLIFIKLRDNQMLSSVALTTIFSGAIGNLLDRIKYGYVVDFLQFQLGDKVFPSKFNLADVSIIVGVILMFVSTVKKGNTSVGDERSL